MALLKQYKVLTGKMSGTPVSRFLQNRKRAGELYPLLTCYREYSHKKEGNLQNYIKNGEEEQDYGIRFPCVASALMLWPSGGSKVTADAASVMLKDSHVFWNAAQPRVGPFLILTSRPILQLSLQEIL